MWFFSSWTCNITEILLLHVTVGTRSRVQISGADSPVYFVLALLLENIVCFFEMFTIVETASSHWGRMSTLQSMVLFAVYQFSFLLGKSSPQQEYEPFFLFVKYPVKVRILGFGL